MPECPYFAFILWFSLYCEIVNICCLPLIHCRSMVNCITLNSTSRVVLASCRNAFTMVSWYLNTVLCNYLTSLKEVFTLSCPDLDGWNPFFKVANLSLYGVAFVVFNVKTSNTVVDVENQVFFLLRSGIFLIVQNFILFVLLPCL